jgi:hypothetical protein
MAASEGTRMQINTFLSVGRNVKCESVNNPLHEIIKYTKILLAKICYGL